MVCSKVLLFALLGMCLISLAQCAAVEYVEPDIEAITSSGDDGAEDEQEAGSGDDSSSVMNMSEDHEMSGDMDDKDGSGEEGAEEEEGSGKNNEESDTDMDDSSSDKDELKIKQEVDTMKKINDVGDDDESGESDESSSSSSSAEEEGESSSPGANGKGMSTKCSGGIEGILAAVSSANDTGSKDCQLKTVLQSMVELLKVLSSDVAVLKGQVNKTCSGGGSGKGDDSDEDSAESKEEEAKSSKEGEASEGGVEGEEEEDDDGKKSKKCDDDDKEEGELETTSEAAMETTTAGPTTPPPPAGCPPPFQLLADSCYYIQTDPREGRSWGEAHSFCQQQGGTLAAPYRTQELRNYLSQSYSNSFWVGARKVDQEWRWMTGRSLQEDDWKSGRPNMHPSKRCVYIDSFNGYKGTNHFCGEKFSFICEHRGV